jgi:hypothetical protein
MTIFPDLIPSTRTYSPGEYPITPHPLLSGAEIRVRHSNTVLGVRLRLTFQAATSADVVAVRNHYNGRQGGFLPFAIPVELLSGVTTPADFTPAGHQWVYASRPRVVDVPIAGDTPTNRHDLVVELVTVPPENTIVSGARITVRATVRGGSAQLGAYIESFASVVGGAATVEASTEALGAAITSSASVVGGSAAGDPLVDPLTAVVSISAGAASAGAIDISAITYSQVSVWSANTAATNAGMTNGVSAETLQTGTNFATTAWVQMDLGGVYTVANVYVGCDFTNTLAGGWGKTYAEDLTIQYSNDAATWTDSGVTTGTFSTGIKAIAVSFTARYIRVVRLNNYIAITEFYATST